MCRGKRRHRGRLAFAPKFDADGLVTCVATDVWTGDVLMVAHMNAEALQRTIETGEAWYYSRSRQALWKKGESSGHVQRVREMRVDCDQDAVWIKVEQQGAGACHTGRQVLLLPRGAAARHRRGDAGIPRRGKDLRSAGGLRQARADPSRASNSDDLQSRSISLWASPWPAAAGLARDAGGRTSRRRCRPCRRRDWRQTPRSPPPRA